VAVALAVGVGGLVYGVTIDHEHGDHGGHKLIA
jgi:hypothetical protein